MAVVDADVKAIVDTSRDTTPFIGTASLLVSEILAGTSLTPARLDKITLYLAAHFVWLTETFGLTAKRSGDMQEEYHPRGENPPPMGFMTSIYGKTALALDTSGKLAAASANSGLKARFQVYAQPQRWGAYYPWWGSC